MCLECIIFVINHYLICTKAFLIRVVYLKGVALLHSTKFKNKNIWRCLLSCDKAFRNLGSFEILPIEGLLKKEHP